LTIGQRSTVAAAPPTRMTRTVRSKKVEQICEELAGGRGRRRLLRGRLGRRRAPRILFAAGHTEAVFS
jgi:hypothetical protein